MPIRRRTMRKSVYAVILIALLITSCAPWVMSKGEVYTSKTGDYSIRLPEGWVRTNAQLAFGDTKGDLLATRDGLLLQQIMIQRLGVNRELNKTKRMFRKGMLPSEAAKVITDLLSSNENMQNFKVVKNVPVKLNGSKGFKATFKYKTTDDLWVKMVYYGFIKGETFYGISYVAPQRYYFKKDLKPFKKAVKTFKLI
jgi:hypothetical protein